MNKEEECLNNNHKDKCCKYIPYMLPPGPPGPTEPATIEIGTVTTGEPVQVHLI